LNELNLSIQIELKEIFWGFYLCKKPIANWKTDLGEFPRPFFVQCDDEMIELVGFHEARVKVPPSPRQDGTGMGDFR
jgi:hypothetical protein